MRRKDPELMLRIKEYAENYYSEYLRSPSLETIAQGLGIVRSTVYRYLLDMDAQGMVSYDGNEISSEVISKMNPKFSKAALIGSIACGQPNFAEENIEGYIPLPEAIFGQGDFYVLKARGESMIEAGIDNGDLVVIRKQDCAAEGDIIVALVDGEATLKRYFKDEENHRVILHPENSTMEDIYVDNCNIQGVAVNIIKNVH